MLAVGAQLMNDTAQAAASFAGAILFASIPGCVVEGRGPIESWSRSAQLTKGYRWRLFGLALLLMVMSQVATKIIGLVAFEAAV